MKKRFLVAAATLALTATGAFAEVIFLFNGSFEAQGSIASPGFTQNITNWTISYTPDSAPPANIGQHSGIFTSFGTYTATDASHFVGISNLGAGTVRMASNVFFLGQRGLEFDFAYVSNDLNAVGGDTFSVLVEIFSDALQTTQIASQVWTIADSASQPALIGTAPYTGANTYSRAGLATYQTVFLPLASFFQNYARVTFIVDNTGPSPGGVNGLGVSGVLLDNIVMTPEPGTLGLFGLGALGLLGLVRRRRKLAAAARA